MTTRRRQATIVTGQAALAVVFTGGSVYTAAIGLPIQATLLGFAAGIALATVWLATSTAYRHGWLERDKGEMT